MGHPQVSVIQFNQTRIVHDVIMMLFVDTVHSTWTLLKLFLAAIDKTTMIATITV